MNTQPSRASDVPHRASRNAVLRVLDRYFHKQLDRLDHALNEGGIEAALPDGSVRVLGCRTVGPVAIVELTSWRALVRLATGGSAGWYEAWEAGEWSSPDPVPLFDLFVRNRGMLGAQARASGPSRFFRWVLHRRNANSKAKAKHNIVAHYDLGNTFYAAWLDPTMSYSSAMFADPRDDEESLEAAQDRKWQALADRLRLHSKSKLLEIGCGWGHFATQLAERGHDVTAITLSPSQRDWAETSVCVMHNPPTFLLQDYRDVDGTFDAIVSVEMVEAVGQEYWAQYLNTIARCLKPGGRAAIQFIAIADDVFEPYASSADFVQTYVFPGGMLLSESRFRGLAEAAGFAWEDSVHFGPSYAETLRRWRLRFDDAIAAGALPPQFDDRFVRLWRYYLQYCEGGFRGGGIDVAQVTLIKKS
jgi:cyclopropane-fatty-acyl-phospholipid synthase